MDTRQLRNFLKIAETGSITRAADALGVAQPSLSQQVLRLEDEVGFKLFRRTTRGVTTTPAGDILQKHARQMLEIAEHAVEEMREGQEEARAKVVLAMPFSISRLLAMPLAEAAMEETPAVSLRVREAFSGPIRAMLLEGAVDLGLLYDVEPLDPFVVKRLAREELYLIGPAGKLAASSHVPLSELGALPMILPGPAHGLRTALDQEAERLGVRLKIASEIDTLEHIVRLVVDRRGYSILPLSAIESELCSGAISAAQIDGGFGRTLCLARLPGAATTDASRRIEALVIRLLEGLMAKGRWLATPAAEAKPDPHPLRER
ncbi:LysR family transcriptional regulator [Phenylobacterium sp. LjRoot225]|uniref:LysR family transcriptional regulator n=1 Tax=Phenylobacterium sp. LjRoot225 TaxID=3342285 RepID=UPI003ED137C7